MNTHKMSNPDKLTHGRDQTSRIWRKFMDYTGGAEKEGSSRAISVAIGEDYGPTRGALELMGHLKVIGTRSEYELRRQRVFYRPLMNLADGYKTIDAHFAAGRGMNYFKKLREQELAAKRALAEAEEVVAEATALAEAVIAEEPKTNGVTIATRETEETRAIAGPDSVSPFEALRPMRKDEAEALLEAARQYAHRGDALATKLGELEALGIHIDFDKMADAVSMEPDPILAAVAGLLPMVDRMLAANQRLTEEREAMRNELVEKRRETGVLAQEVNNLKDANRRLSERNVTLSGELAEQREQRALHA
jgi:cell division septum initiation protein DivIVA